MPEETVLRNVGPGDIARLTARINDSQDFRIVKFSDNLKYVILRDSPLVPQTTTEIEHWGHNKEHQSIIFSQFMPQDYIGFIRGNNAGLLFYKKDDFRSKKLEVYEPKLRTLMETCWWGE